MRRLAISDCRRQGTVLGSQGADAGARTGNGFGSRPAAASSSTAWCRRIATGSPEPSATPCCSSRDDAGRLGLADGDPVVLQSDAGEMRAVVRLAPIAPGNVQVHWPEGNSLIGSGRRSAEAGIPDYNAEVLIQRL